MGKEQQLVNYFTVEKPVFKLKGLIYFLITWGIVILVFLLIAKPAIWFKLILVAGLAVWAYLKYFRPYFSQLSLFNSRYSDKEVDDMFETTINDVINQIIKKEGIDEEDDDELKAPTFIVCTPSNGYSREGNDGKFRSAVWTIEMLFFKEDSALYYNGEFSHIENSLKNEQTRRVFYKDIISPVVTKDGYLITLELKGTDIIISFELGYFPVHGKNRTSDVDFTVKALEKLMYSTKYKVVN
ncbi:MAG: hypothetical protein Q8867_02915 [Bacteroidota bacterium]|nr:hypothetical protein [Bacteroidota bacterium]